MIEWLFQYFQSNVQPIILGFILGSFTLWLVYRVFSQVFSKNNFIEEQLDEILTKMDDLSKHMGVKNENLEHD